MGGEAIGRCGVEGKGKETAVLLLREDERRPSWSFLSEKMRGEGQRELETGPVATRLNISTPRRAKNSIAVNDLTSNLLGLSKKGALRKLFKKLFQFDGSDASLRSRGSMNPD